MKNYWFICLCVIFNFNFSFSQVNIDLSLNKSFVRTTGELSFNFPLKKWFISLDGEGGVIGKRSFLNDFSQKDGYGGIYNNIDYSGGYQYKGFEHNFIGFGVGLGFGRKVVLNEKHYLSFGLHSKFYVLNDHYIHYYSSTASNNETVTEKRVIPRKTIDLNLDFNYFYKLSQRFDLNIGVNVPFIFPTLKNTFISYLALSSKLPASDFEPYLKIGVRFNFIKNEIE